jgi:hypothetical protein
MVAIKSKYHNRFQFESDSWVSIDFWSVDMSATFKYSGPSFKLSEYC